MLLDSNCSAPFLISQLDLEMGNFLKGQLKIPLIIVHKGHLMSVGLVLRSLLW